MDEQSGYSNPDTSLAVAQVRCIYGSGLCFDHGLAL